MVLSRRVQVGFFTLAVMFIGAGVIVALFLLKPNLVTIVPGPPIPIDGTQNSVVKQPVTIETNVAGRCISLAFGPGSFLETGDCGSLRFAGSWTLYPQTQTLVYATTTHIACMVPPTDIGETRVVSSEPDSKVCEGINLDERDGIISSKNGFFIGMQPGNVPVWVPDRESATRWDIRFAPRNTGERLQGCPCSNKNQGVIAKLTS